MIAHTLYTLYLDENNKKWLRLFEVQFNKLLNKNNSLQTTALHDKSNIGILSH